MNDTELDDMLNKWDAPPVPRDLRQRIDPGRLPKRRFRLPSGLFFGLAAGAAMFLLAVGVAAPQSFTGSIPFTVDSQILQYKSGSMALTEYRTEYLRDGAPVILSSEYPDNPLMTLHNKFFNAMSLILYPLVREVHGRAAETAFANFVRNGCVWPPAARVVSHKTILGHDTVEVQVGKGESTDWRAPDLGCFPLRSTWETTLADGTPRITWEKQALKITRQ